MVKCKTQNCVCIQSEIENLCQHYTIWKYECFQKQNACRKFSRMTDGMYSSNNELKVNNWEGFHNWLYCICVVTFDLELGQALEVPVQLTLLSIFCIVHI